MLRNKQTIVLNMSNECLDAPYMPDDWDVRLDYYEMSGINCYLDDESGKNIRDDLRKYGPEGIHYIDNGNYHYLSLLFLEMIEEDFALVLYDNHPDMKPPTFGGITSCGGWVLEAAERLEHLKRIYMIGMESALIDELGTLHEKVVYIKSHKDGDWREQRVIDGITNEYELVDNDISEVLANESLPLAISLDLDVLKEDEFQCGWSQGIMTAAEMKSQVVSIINNHDVIMIDVCG
ncbi:MAG: hypothetical protein IJ655_06805 [Lachnospiraceae bacterium]|nr:hypothetical protein [Lachnospiraceae bacterium]